MKAKILADRKAGRRALGGKYAVTKLC